ncbi:hypothetical protein GCM10017554_15430 [Acinetobacter modestus]|jgi:hypothetical protein|nr:hypothetical protein GCM10017554_15430 [Acinetobacter modestus]
MTGINGAQANQAKKQTKKASQLMWNARIAGAEKLNNLIDVAFFADKSKDIAISYTERILLC